MSASRPFVSVPDTAARGAIYVRAVDVGSAGSGASAEALDGYVASHEAADAILRLDKEIELQEQRGLPAEDLRTQRRCLVAVEKRARQEEASGNKRGYAYMSEAFYRLDLDREERRAALWVDFLGDRNGLPTARELTPGSLAWRHVASRWPSLTPAQLRLKLPTEVAPRAWQGGVVPLTRAEDSLFSYRDSYEQMKAGLHQLAGQFSQLLSVEDIGDSHGKVNGVNDHDVWAAHLSGKGGRDGDKPTVVWLMGMHGDEIVNPYMAMRWIEGVLRAYGKNPEVTGLLDTCKIAVVVMTNTDGYPDSRYNSARIDLNRDFRTDDYSSGTPREHPEPEIAGVMDFIRRERPTLFIDWHSSGYVVGHGAERWNVPSPIPEEAMEQVSRRFAAFANYDLTRWRRFGGTSDEWAREQGIPSLTVETCSSKQPWERDVEKAWERTEPLMTYSARIAAAPLELVKGPDAHEARVEGGALTATLSTSERHRIAGGEWVLDPTTPAGQGTPVRAKDGVFDSTAEEVTGDVSVATSAEGQRLVYVRGRDEAGHWGPLTAAWLSPSPA